MSNFSTRRLIIKNANGVEHDCSQIEDMWHLAHSLPVDQQVAVLKVWHQAHTMQDRLIELGELS